MNLELFAATTQDDEEEEMPRPIVPELDDFEEEEIDDIFNRLQGV